MGTERLDALLLLLLPRVTADPPSRARTADTVRLTVWQLSSPMAADVTVG